MSNELSKYLSGFMLLGTAACGSAHGGALFAECENPDCVPSSKAGDLGRAGAGGDAPPNDFSHSDGLNGVSGSSPDSAETGRSGGGSRAENDPPTAGGGASGGAASADGSSELMTTAGGTASVSHGGRGSCMTRKGDATALALYDGTSAAASDPRCSLALAPPRTGTWMAFDDGSAAPAPTASIDARMVTSSEHGCVVESAGSGASQWGGGIHFALDGADSSACAYDASAYRGLVLYLSGTTSGTQGANYQPTDNLVRVNVVSTATSDSDGSCTPSDGKCNDHFGVWCIVSDNWTRCEVPFDNLSQRGWGAVKRFDTTQLLGIEVLAVRDSSAPQPTSWDFSVDDVAFYP